MAWRQEHHRHEHHSSRIALLDLQPQFDDLVRHTELSVTRSTPEIRDAAHLHGVMAHPTAVSAELIPVAPVAQFNQPPPTRRPERNET